MSFDKIFGQSRPKTILQNALKNNRLAQSYLFYGPPGVGKEMMAFEVAKAVNCLEPDQGEGCGGCSACRRIVKLQHPDVRFIFPVPSSLKPADWEEIMKEKAANPHRPIRFDRKTAIAIDTVRGIKDEAAYRVYEGNYKVFIIREVEAMTTQAANALLKLLEEPPEKMLLLLTSSHPQSLLPTILSRCQQIRFELLEENIIEHILQQTYGLPSDRARLLSRLAGGSLAFAWEMMEEDLEDIRTQVGELFACARQEDTLKLFGLAEELATGRNVSLLEKILKMLQGYYRDILMIKSQQRERIINLDILPGLEQAAETLPVPAAVSSIQEIEKALGLLARNPNLSLLVFNLVQRLKDIGQGPPVS